MPYPKPDGLTAHRKQLANNLDCFSQDKDRATKNWTSHAWQGIKNNVPSSKKKEDLLILKEMACMIWDAQGGKPLFQFNDKDELPLAWNRPMDGNKNYIRYEVGHLKPRNAGGTSCTENLCYQSARCNQHIQGALSIETVIEAYFNNNSIVLNRIQAIYDVYKSKQWMDFKSKL